MVHSKSSVNHLNNFTPSTHLLNRTMRSSKFPLAFVLMSRRRCKDYKKVLKAIKNLLHDEVKLQCVVADFETALWQAVQTVFPNVRLQGCLFH